jgi:acetolactate decarboxylase
MASKVGINDINNDWMTGTVTQVGILNAIIAGQLDGHLPCAELLQYGDLGIGSYDQMDGEMFIVDGSMYWIKSDGKVYAPDPSNRTPFAVVCRFRPDQEWTINGPVDLDAIQKLIDEKAPNQNVFCAVRIHGTFSWVNTHALPLQSKPYPPPAEMIKTVPQFEMKNVTGTIVGFRAPPYVREVNDPGYHLHFLTDDKTQGGHLRKCIMDEGEVSIQICGNHMVILPENGASLAGVDLSRDLVKEFLDEVSHG